MTLSGIFTGTYAIANRAGLLKSNAAKRAFSWIYFLYKRRYEDPYHRLLSVHSQLLKGGHVLDIGANIGYSACLFANAVDSDSRVFAFEPDRGNFEMLQHNIASRSIDSVVIPIQAAVGAREGVVDIWINRAHHADHRVATEQLRRSLSEDEKTVSVPMLSVDDFSAECGIRQNICFIKMDVQGYEPEVCKGMTTTLDENPGIKVAVEFDPTHLDSLGFVPDELLDFFEQRGFSPYRIDRESALSKVETKTLREMRPGSPGYVDLLYSRDTLM